jgi:hypothetical protein
VNSCTSIPVTSTRPRVGSTSLAGMSTCKAVSVTAAIVARSTDPDITQAHVFLVFAALMAGSLPLMLLVPEHRGRW